MRTTPNGVLNNILGTKHTIISVIIPPQCLLTHHLAWYAHFIFTVHHTANIIQQNNLSIVSFTYETMKST